jgi:hypothetical protein
MGLDLQPNCCCPITPLEEAAEETKNSKGHEEQLLHFLHFFRKKKTIPSKTCIFQFDSLFTEIKCKLNEIEIPLRPNCLRLLGID